MCQVYNFEVLVSTVHRFQKIYKQSFDNIPNVLSPIFIVEY